DRSSDPLCQPDVRDDANFAFHPWNHADPHGLVRIHASQGALGGRHMSEALLDYRRVWQRKPALREIYGDFCKRMAAAPVPGITIEIVCRTCSRPTPRASGECSDRLIPWGITLNEDEAQDSTRDDCISNNRNFSQNCWGRRRGNRYAPRHSLSS